jgi:hypothetical protein
MAHFAELDENNVVRQVIVVSNQDILDSNGDESEDVGINFCKKLFGQNTVWKQTSYNNNFRCRYAGIGMIYEDEYDVFLHKQPYPSWFLDTEDYEWYPPIAEPKLTEEQKEYGSYYGWNEENQEWELKTTN